MALHPGRQRSRATPIIAKGLLYPLQNRCASKSATHGFVSKLDTHHNTKATRKRGFCVGWDDRPGTDGKPTQCIRRTELYEKQNKTHCQNYENGLHSPLAANIRSRIRMPSRDSREGIFKIISLFTVGSSLRIPIHI